MAGGEVVGADEQHDEEALVRRHAARDLPVGQPPQQVLRLVAWDGEYKRRVRTGGRSRRGGGGERLAHSILLQAEVEEYAVAKQDETR